MRFIHPPGSSQHQAKPPCARMAPLAGKARLRLARTAWVAGPPIRCILRHRCQPAPRRHAGVAALTPARPRAEGPPVQKGNRPQGLRRGPARGRPRRGPLRETAPAAEVKTPGGTARRPLLGGGLLPLGPDPLPPVHVDEVPSRPPHTGRRQGPFSLGQVTDARVGRLGNALPPLPLIALLPLGWAWRPRHLSVTGRAGLSMCL